MKSTGTMVLLFRGTTWTIREWSAFLNLLVCCSVLIHLLPGLALFAHRYAPVPESLLSVWRRVVGGEQSVAVAEPAGIFWIFGAPLVFYVIWQLMYFIIVQVRGDMCLANHALKVTSVVWGADWSRVCCLVGDVQTDHPEAWI